ncbi:hypothetical protein SEEN4900_16847 [Salmonella enterica subsp. enterica serovar Newport str. WA_14900]|nr:hypothetical protein SEEN4900_16847 [Salmonella enterica subsp. enterica serovar Newport str. WA_14900]KAF0780791.1 hypothetical protein L246_27660 [Salmonella enterica subsp. enterica serovar Worthington str. BCH-5715]
MFKWFLQPAGAQIDERVQINIVIQRTRDTALL